MTDDLDDVGPIDYLVVEFPGARLTGEALPTLLDLIDGGIIRILDLVFMRKEADGWASPFVAALRRAGGELVSAGRIPVGDLVAALDETEPVDA